MSLDLTQGSIKTHILTLSVPAVVGYFFHTMFNVTDTYFAGLISTQALAALSLSASIFFMILAVGIGMSEAVTSLIGNALGEKQTNKAQNIAYNAIIFGLILSILLAFLGLVSIPYLVTLLGDPSYTKETLEYINIILYCCIFFIGAFFFNAFLNALGDTKSFRNVLIFTTFLNIFLDYIFVNTFAFGVSGIAFATIISEAIVMFYLLYKVKKTSLWPELQNRSYNPEFIKELLKQGLPPSINMFMMAFGMYIITYFVAPYGKEAVAAFGIGMRIEQIFLMPVIGLNVAALAIISQNNGARAYERIEPTLKQSIYYGWGMSTLGVTCFLLFAPYLASLLTSDPIVIEQTSLYLRVSGIASYGFVVIFIYIAMLQGIAEPSIIMPVSIYRQLIAPVILFSTLAYLGVDIVYLWIGLNMIIFSAAIFLWWYGSKKIQNLSLTTLH